MTPRVDAMASRSSEATPVPNPEIKSVRSVADKVAEVKRLDLDCSKIEMPRLVLHIIRKLGRLHLDSAPVLTLCSRNAVVLATPILFG